MGKLHKTLKQLSPVYHLDHEVYDELHPMGTQAETAYDAKVASEKALKEAENQPTIPLPDEEELARVRRRENARRRGSGRSSTVYGDSDSMGG